MKCWLNGSQRRRLGDIFIPDMSRRTLPWCIFPWLALVAVRPVPSKSTKIILLYNHLSLYDKLTDLYCSEGWRSILTTSYWAERGLSPITWNEMSTSVWHQLCFIYSLIEGLTCRASCLLPELPGPILLTEDICTQRQDKLHWEFFQGSSYSFGRGGGSIKGYVSRRWPRLLCSASFCTSCSCISDRPPWLAAFKFH